MRCPPMPPPRIWVILRSGNPAGAGLVHVIQRRLHWDPGVGWTEGSDIRLEPG